MVSEFLVARCAVVSALPFHLCPPFVRWGYDMDLELGLITTRDIAYRAVEGLVGDSLLSVGVGLGIVFHVPRLLRCLDIRGGVFSPLS